MFLFIHGSVKGVKMLEVSRGCTQEEWPKEAISEKDTLAAIRDKAAKLCRDYLRGAWLSISPQDMIFRKVSGGLSNYLYFCALPEGTETISGEPDRLLLRLYGNMNHERAMETLVTESVIFTLLSESQRGPRLYGVFPGGRLEEYIEARPLCTQELADATLSSLIADKMAQIHLMDVPINKQPKRLWQTMERWIRQINNINASNNVDESVRDMMNTLEQINLYEEYVWLKDYLTNVKSPVVFCHNDLQEGNILLRNNKNITDNRKKSMTGKPDFEPDYENLTSESLVVIDFEYCSYNYRGFDFANHFCEWVYDYSNEEPPYFWEMQCNQPNIKQKEHFVQNYLQSLKKYPEYKPHPEDNLESIMNEIEAFTLAVHFFWLLWSVTNSTDSGICFDYWGFGEVRLQAYYRHKKKVLADIENNKSS
ncbi:choline/ethanolamine kinase isoform X2 [Halyomorpha halys]|uniref:choline/ethanolamine kinase isoform X2 n=1 Tax=Halyomorpha halys TaxID=286706 RepID=UPI0006D512E0|nr:choline/ethanolamine kinase-like isoform X2 [Halyomorpha halys]